MKLNELKMSFEIWVLNNVFDDFRHKVCICRMHCDVESFYCDGWKPPTMYIFNIASKCFAVLSKCETILNKTFIEDGKDMLFFQFNTSSQLSPETPGFLAIPSTKDKTHIVVLVLDATIIDVFPEEIVQKIKKLQDKCNQKGNYDEMYLNCIHLVLFFVSRKCRTCTLTARCTQYQFTQISILTVFSFLFKVFLKLYFWQKLIDFAKHCK